MYISKFRFDYTNIRYVLIYDVHRSEEAIKKTTNFFFYLPYQINNYFNFRRGNVIIVTDNMSVKILEKKLLFIRWYNKYTRLFEMYYWRRRTETCIGAKKKKGQTYLFIGTRRIFN